MKELKKIFRKTHKNVHIMVAVILLVLLDVQYFWVWDEYDTAPTWKTMTKTLIIMILIILIYRIMDIICIHLVKRCLSSLSEEQCLEYAEKLKPNMWKKDIFLYDDFLVANNVFGLIPFYYEDIKKVYISQKSNQKAKFCFVLNHYIVVNHHKPFTTEEIMERVNYIKYRNENIEVTFWG